MAANLKHIARVRYQGLVWMLAFFPALSVAEEALVDPTRPPERRAAKAEPADAGGSELQSVIISPTRRAAIIRGQMVELGGKVGDFRLIEVNEGGVVLQGTKGLEVLTLFPNIKVNRKPAMSSAKEQSVRNGRAEEEK